MRFWRKFPAGSVIDSLAFLYSVLPLPLVLWVKCAEHFAQDVVCWYCSRPAMHCEKNEFPPPPDELGNFPSQFFKKWTCRNLVTTLLPSSSEYVINWQQSFTFIISNAYIFRNKWMCVARLFSLEKKPHCSLKKKGSLVWMGNVGGTEFVRGDNEEVHISYTWFCIEKGNYEKKIVILESIDAQLRLALFSHSRRYCDIVISLISTGSETFIILEKLRPRNSSKLL